MSIEYISAQSNLTAPPPVPGTTGAGQDDLTARMKIPQKENGVVQLFPQKEGSETKSTADKADQVSAMVEDLQESLEMLQQKHTQLNFSVHEKTDRVMVRITDQDSGDVIREIPSEEFLDMAAKLQEMVGLMFDMKI